MRKTNPTPRTLAMAALATGLLAAGILVAAPPAGDHDGMHRMHRMGAAFLDKVDANKDGNISQAEHDAMRAAHLGELDRNNDGFVTFEEQKAAREARKAAREATAAERFTKRHDKDGDGRVSVDELAQRGEGMFERMDTNKDGMVTREEMQQNRGKRVRHGGGAK